MRRTAAPQVNRLRERVENWRKQQGKRTVIPEALWEEAARVAKLHGVWATARATRFNSQRLRQRVERLRECPSGQCQELAVLGASMARVGSEAAVGPGPAFVELSPSALGGSGRTVIDVVGRHGERMHLEVSGGVDVVGLVRTFWGGHS
jgi:hypothetical protein